MTSPGTRVVRVRPLVQAVAIPLLAVFVVGIAWGAVGAVVHDDAAGPFRSSHLGPVGVTIGWIIATVVFAGALSALLVIARLRIAVSEQGFDARLFFRHHRLDRDQLTRVQVLRATRPTGRFPAVRVTARDATGRRRGFQVDAVFTGITATRPAIESWVRANPALVQDDLTRAAFADVLATAARPS